VEIVDLDSVPSRGKKSDLCIDIFKVHIHNFSFNNAPVAQLDRVPGYELGGREFESLRARHFPQVADRSVPTNPL
jgi:hypothetical protein